MKRALLAAVVVLVLAGCGGPDPEAAVHNCMEQVVALERADGGEIDLEYIQDATAWCQRVYEEDPEKFIAIYT